jgi:hypothetical protein
MLITAIAIWIDDWLVVQLDHGKVTRKLIYNLSKSNFIKLPLHILLVMSIAVNV